MLNKINYFNRLAMVTLVVFTSVVTTFAASAEQAVRSESELETVEPSQDTLDMWLNPDSAEVVFSFFSGCFPSESKDYYIDPVFTEGTAYDIYSEPMFFVGEESNSVAEE